MIDPKINVKKLYVTTDRIVKCMKDKIPDKFNNKPTHKGDTGASHDYWMKNDKNILTNITKTYGTAVQLPNNQMIMANSQGELPLPSALSTKARTAMIVPKLTSSNLISIGQLCDDGCNIKISQYGWNIVFD